MTLPRHFQPVIDWPQMDWRRSDRYLAQQIGCSIQTVNGHRRHLNAGPPDKTITRPCPPCTPLTSTT